VRYHTAWLKENEMCCYIPDDYVFQKVGFHCSLSLICSLTLHKTKKGYRVFRTPNENIKTLRRKCEKVELTASQILDVPCEYVFTLEQSVTFVLNGKSLIYAHDKKSVRSSSDKEYEICGKTPPKIRMIVDTMSVEFCVNDETMLTYYLKTAEMPLEIVGVDKIKAKKYPLSSIWEKKTTV
jgi:sucrose-6-phosphate hydrolase SacC (GH32 family)